MPNNFEKWETVSKIERTVNSENYLQCLFAIVVTNTLSLSAVHGAVIAMGS